MNNPFEGHPYRSSVSPEERARLEETRMEVEAELERRRLGRSSRKARREAEKREREEFINNERTFLKQVASDLNHKKDSEVMLHKYEILKWANVFIAERYGRNKISNEKMMEILENPDASGFAERQVLETISPSEKYLIAVHFILEPQFRNYLRDPRYRKLPKIPKPTPKKPQPRYGSDFDRRQLKGYRPETNSD